ncbi:hypothetical protein Bca4012_065628 [Brassica carinata]
MADRKLLRVAESVEALYSILDKDPFILQSVSEPYVHTPLHEASIHGKVDMAVELMMLAPSFSTKLNTRGFSPLHLAVENFQLEIAIELINFDPNLVHLRGRGGVTPLHLVVEKGDVDLLTEFLMACPKSILDVNALGETALHTAVLKGRYDELKAVKLLLKCNRVDRNGQNKDGFTPLDILRANGRFMEKRTEKLMTRSGGKSKASLSNVKTSSEFLRSPVNFWNTAPSQ